MRLLRCTACRDDVRVHEEPCEFIDPTRYVCGQCLEPAEQLELTASHTTIREEARRYDPSIAAFPEGY